MFDPIRSMRPPGFKSVRRIFRRAPRTTAPDAKHDEPEDAYYNLPLELLVHILSFLPLADLLRCRQVCTRLKHVIDDTVEMQYKIELLVAGLEDNERRAALPISTRLQTLKSICHSRKNPSGTWQKQVIGDWVNDVFNVRYYENMWIRCRKDGELAGRHRWNSIQCVSWEPLESGRIVSDTWALSFEFSFECFGADPSRNLLFLLDTRSVTVERTYRVWTVSLTTGNLVDEHLFEINENTPTKWSVHMLPVLGDLIGAFTFENLGDPGSFRLTVMNVTTREYATIYRENLPRTARVSFHILTASCLLLHFFDDGVTTTEVYALRRTSARGTLAIYHVTTFEYPKFLARYINGNRNQTELLGRICGSSVSRHVAPRPHCVPTSSTIIYMLRYIGRPGPDNPRLVHIMPVSTFITVAEAFVPLLDQVQLPITVPWKDWGPMKSRCFIDYSSHLYGAYGYKVLLPDFTLLDFNPVDIARDLHHAANLAAANTPETKPHAWKRLKSLRRPRGAAKGSEAGKEAEPPLDDVNIPGTTSRIIRKPNTVSAEDMFEEDITTSLPYRETKLPWTGPEVVASYGGEVWVTCAKHRYEDGSVVDEYWAFQPDRIGAA